MTHSEDIRWKQRFSNYSRALAQLREFAKQTQLNSMEEQGLIKAFEYTFELSWNVMKDFFESQGEANILGSRDAIRLAFKRGLITDGKNWMKMIESRIKTAHTYNEATADEVAKDIVALYLPLFESLHSRLDQLK